MLGSTLFVSLDEDVWDGHEYAVCDVHMLEKNAAGECPWC